MVGRGVSDTCVDRPSRNDATPWYLEFLNCSQNICKILGNLRICKGAPSPPKKLNFQDFQTISGRSWKLLHSNPQNDVIFGRFQRQRFFLNCHCKSQRQLIRMTKRTWKVQVFAYFPSISDQKAQKYQTQGFHGILEFLDCSQNICKILKNLRICKGAPSPPKKLNFQDFQTIGGRSWKLLHFNPQTTSFLEGSSDISF